VIVNDAGGALAPGDIRLVLTPASQLPLADVTRVPAVGDVVLEPGVATPVPPGEYALLVQGVPDGYEIELPDACAPAAGIPLAYGDVLECAVTIDDVAPTLHVTVESAEGAPAPTVTLDGVPVEAGVEVPITAGSHRLAVESAPGFEARLDGDCGPDGRFEAALAERVECAIVVTAAGPRPTPTGTPTPTPTSTSQPTPTTSAPAPADDSDRPPVGGLAATGASVAVTLGAGLVVLAAGATLLVLRRRRVG
jgi:hypothetical protein